MKIHESTHKATESRSRVLDPSLLARKSSRPEYSGTNTLRQRLGNQGVQRLMSETVGQTKDSAQPRSSAIQAKLAVSQPRDEHEQETDRVANAVMRMSEPSVQETSLALPVAPSAAANIQSLRGGGSALPAGTRAFFEPRFRADFSQVRLHTDALAADTAKSINAKAFTVGQNIAFGAGEYAPQTTEGKWLLAHELAHVAQQNSSIQRQPKRDPARRSFPWIGRIGNTWSASLRKSPEKNPDQPHRNTLADLPRDTEVRVINQKGGWLLVNVIVDGKTLEGYVSQELVTYVKASATDLGEITLKVKVPSLAEAFVELKKAETRKAKEGSAFKPTEDEQSDINVAMGVLKQTKKYVVDESTYAVTFAHKPGVKTEIDTIEDFVLFVENVEKQYAGASPKEVVSEIRQLWFSDVNWELLVASEGISEAGKDVDIETEPDPIASQFNMKTLAPAAGSKQFDTRMGKVDIGHVMAGIDARLSGFPAAYPKSHLAKKGHDDSDTELKYKTLKAASGGDSRDFATWAGDLGQAYAEYLVERYVKGNASASLSAFSAAKAPSEEILGDIHGYIAVEVFRDVPASMSPTGAEVKVSNILRDMYLVEKSAGGNTYQKQFEKVSGKSGADLKAFIAERSLRFAKPWYAKKAVEHRGWRGSKGWTKEGILENTLKEFDDKHAENEKNANASDKLESLADDLVNQLSGSIK